VFLIVRRWEQKEGNVEPSTTTTTADVAKVSIKRP
jgi:hypothetical protein